MQKRNKSRSRSSKWTSLQIKRFLVFRFITKSVHVHRFSARATFNRKCVRVRNEMANSVPENRFNFTVAANFVDKATHEMRV